MKQIKYITAEEAVRIVQSHHRVYVHGGAAAPTVLTKALTARAGELRNVEVCHIHTEGEAAYADPKYKDSFFVNSLFLAHNVRHTIAAGNGSYTPVFLSEIPNLFDRNILSVDVVFIQVSPPDEHGYCTLGVSVEGTLAAIRNAKYVVAQINPKMPRVFGEGIIHIRDIDFAVEHSCDIFAMTAKEPTEVEQQIGRNIASLIEDGSTLQMGIGSIPNAALSNLGHLKNLGVHTELLTEGVLDLIESGVINGSEKAVDKGKVVATFMLGTKRLYDYVNNNPSIELRESSNTNYPAIIAKNPKMISINSAIEIDVTGQVCADSIGANLYSGVGGQVDFVRGAALSKGGKAILALPSVTRHGYTRIVPFLKQGAGVVTTRSHIQYIVTEYGVAYMQGKTIKERVKALIDIAHPDHRELIERDYFNALK